MTVHTDAVADTVLEERVLRTEAGSFDDLSTHGIEDSPLLVQMHRRSLDGNGAS